MKLSADDIGILGAEDVRQLRELLDQYVAETRCRCALLVDGAGRMLASAGERQGLDETTFASLAAAGFAASNQLAALLGEEEFASLYHHGAERSMFLADIAGAAVLAVLIDQRTSLGLVRLRTRALVPGFADHIARLARRDPSGPIVHMEPGWAAEAESEIDRLFNG
jgi:predicted regulator of Ras-like GTPase activity (Roadblock/LC7/MglB family)